MEFGQSNTVPKDGKNFEESVNEEINEFFGRLPINGKTIVDTDKDTPVTASENAIKANFGVYALVESAAKECSRRLNGVLSETLEKYTIYSDQCENEVPLFDIRMFPTEAEILAADKTYAMYLNENVVKSLSATASPKKQLCSSENETQSLEENMKSLNFHEYEVPLVDTRGFRTEAEIVSQNETNSMYLKERVTKKVRYFLNGPLPSLEAKTKKLKENVIILNEVPLEGDSKVLDEVQSVTITHSFQKQENSTTLQNPLQATPEINIPKDCEEHIPETGSLKNTEKPTSEEFVSSMDLNKIPLPLEITESDEKAADKKTKNPSTHKIKLREAASDEIFCRRLKAVAALVEAEEYTAKENADFVKKDYFGIVKRLSKKVGVNRDQGKRPTSKEHSSNTSETADNRHMPGEEVISLNPLVCILTEKRVTTFCSHCFSRLVPCEEKECTICWTAWYCNEVCQSQDAPIHEKECPYILMATKRNGFPHDMVRLMARLWWKLEDDRNKDIGDDIGGQTYCYRYLESRKECVQLGEENKKLMADMYKLLIVYLYDCSIPLDEFSDLFMRVYRHHLVIENPPHGMLGLGMYIGLSAFQHSCNPTANLVFEKCRARVVVRTEIDTKDLSLVTLSFVDRLLPTEARHVALEFFTGSKCHCNICELGNFEYVSRTMACNTCGFQKMKKLEQLLKCIKQLNPKNNDDIKNAACDALDFIKDDVWDLSYVRAGLLTLAANTSRILASADAIEYYKDLRIIYRFLLGYFDPKTVEVLYYLAEEYFDAGYEKLAKKTYIECLEATVNTYGWKSSFFRELRFRYAVLDSFKWSEKIYLETINK